ncbi:MAG: nucleotidyltransferase domain-containing protein [Bacilli bacterium]|nr:nucleotidyltransferase domain-containing protein [Bacilli bacterium]
MASNQIEYISNYNKQNYKMYQFRVKKSDTDLIDKLDNVENRNAYLTSLVLNDIKPGILTIKEIKNRIRPVVEKHHIEEVYLFGSYARGEANENSDVDIYCSSGDVETLLDEVGLVEELEEALGKNVDVVTIGSEMQDFFRQQLEEDKIRIC